MATLPRILRYLTVAIETLRPSDWVLARDEHAPDGELVLRQVEERFERTAYALVHLTLRDSAGRSQTTPTSASRNRQSAIGNRQSAFGNRHSPIANPVQANPAPPASP